MRIFLLSILTIMPFFFLAAAENEKEEENSKKEKKESFVDYFNFIPKVSKEFAHQDDFSDFSGLIIRNIDVHFFDRFSPQITALDLDTVATQDENYKKSHKKLVKRQLLFKEGEIVDAALFADAERYLRENTIYTDAFIEVIPTQDCLYADIVIYVIDNRHWRAIFSASPEAINAGGTIVDFAGLPQSFQIVGSGLFHPTNPYRFGTSYRMNNIARSQIDVLASFERQNIQQRARLLVEKRFVAYNTKWAGSVDISNTTRKETENGFADEISPHYNMGLINKDIWLARSFAMPHLFPNKKSMRFIVSGRSTINHFYKIPEELPIQNYVNRQFYLGSFGLANRDWYGFEELYRFRDFDYVPKGFNMAILGGHEINQFLGARWYTGATLNYNKLYKKFGYLQKEIRYGAFIRNGNYEQITTQLNIDYFTNRVNIGNYGFRQFVKASTTLSYNRPSTEFFSFSNQIRGLNSNNIKMFGTRSFVLNLESVLYTPIKWWTSRSNIFLFADLGYISASETGFLFSNPIHQGYGIGLRFQHLVTAIDFLQISFGYYPNGQLVGVSPIRVTAAGHPERIIETNNLFNSGIMSNY